MPSSLTMLLPPALGSSPHPPVSVCGTGGACAIAAFLGSMGPGASLLEVRSTSRQADARGIFLPGLALRLCRSFLSRLPFPSCVPAVLACASTGISTCCPSATPPGLALGPDLPRADQLYPGNLGHPADRIPTYLSLLIPAFSLRARPLLLTVQLRPDADAPLPAACIAGSSAASAACFSPGHFRRRDSRLVSCYALFECMAASEPTS